MKPTVDQIIADEHKRPADLSALRKRLRETVSSMNMAADIAEFGIEDTGNEIAESRRSVE